jgi:hypothetical protein
MANGRGRDSRTRIGLASLVAVIATAGGLVILPGRASAAPLVVNVTSTADSHAVGTFREAVDQANAGVFDDVTINLPTGTYVLDLCAVPEDNDNTAGDLDINQSSPVTIAGVGGIATISMTCANERVIDRLGAGLFTLTDVRITGGNAIGAGGGVRANSAVTVTNAEFQANAATGATGTDQVCNGAAATAGGAAEGGAIATNFDVTSINTTFTNNRATGGTGGAVSVVGCPTVPTTGNGGFAFGGAIRTNGQVTIIGGELIGNVSEGGAGGTGLDAPSVTTLGGDAEGGAIWASTGVSLTSTTLSGNLAQGGISSGSARGGAVQSGGVATAADTTVLANEARGTLGSVSPCATGPGGAATGGGIQSSNRLVLVRSTLQQNKATGGSGGTAGGVGIPCIGVGAAGGPAYGGGAIAQEVVSVDASLITANVATAGAGGSSCDQAVCTQLSGGNASGGGIMAGSGLAINASSVKDNIATSGDGATSSFSYGGGIFSSAGSTVTDSSFLHNHARGAAGGVGLQPGQSAGGGLWDNGPITIDGSTFAGNHADNGVGREADGGGQAGGAAAVAPITVTNSTFDANVANNASAGSAIGGTVVTLDYVTVTANVGTSALRGGSLVTARSVIADQVGGVLCEFGATTSNGNNWADDTSCALTDPTDDQAGTDPLLAPLADNGGPTPTRMPDAASPLVDAIVPGSCALFVDQRNATRPGDANCDIGAVERTGVLPTTTTTSTTTSTTTTSTSTTSTSTSTTSSTVAASSTTTAAVGAVGAQNTTTTVTRGSLPVTGSDPQLLTLVAALSIAGGLVLLVTVRARRRA